MIKHKSITTDGFYKLFINCGRFNKSFDFEFGTWALELCNQTPWLTQVEDAIAGPVPSPALQLLVLCVLKPTVVKHHADDALEHTHVLPWKWPQGRWGISTTQVWIWPWRRRNPNAAHLHHFTGDFREFPNFPVVKHSNFIRLTCNDMIITFQHMSSS